jgi:hypothetical protein
MLPLDVAVKHLSFDAHPFTTFHMADIQPMIYERLTQTEKQ